MSVVELLDLTSDEYHADPAPEPSLNSTTARVLLSRTPAHAKAQHPRLSDTPLVKSDSDAMKLGTAVHQILLRDDRIEVIPFDEWRTNESKALVAEALAAGRVPMKPKMWKQAQSVADAIRENVARIPSPTPFTAGTPEATITWQDVGEAWCRARLDWLRNDFSKVWDLKCTSRTADPEVWKRQLFNLGYDVQAAFYVRGVEKMTGVTPEYEWVVVETTPPYAVKRFRLDERAMFAASVKVDAALSIWNECMQANEWPAYDPDVYVAEVPGWQKDTADLWADVDTDMSVPF